MFYLIYKITNTINNKIYIGKHKTNDKNDDYMGSGKILNKAIEKYGVDKFKKETEIVDDEFVARLDTYNIKLGGQGGWDYINDHTNWNGFKYLNENGLNNKSNQYMITANRIKNDKEYAKEISEKISNGLKLYHKTHDFINHWLGKKHTEESKVKIGKANSLKQKGKLISITDIYEKDKIFGCVKVCESNRTCMFNVWLEDDRYLQCGVKIEVIRL